LRTLKLASAKTLKTSYQLLAISYQLTSPACHQLQFQQEKLKAEG